MHTRFVRAALSVGVLTGGLTVEAFAAGPPGRSMGPPPSMGGARPGNVVNVYNVSPRYYGYGYGFGYFPGGYGSVWSNGFSLYGPPVPTYGPVPGAFGGSDQRLDVYPPGYAFPGIGIVIPLNRPNAVPALVEPPFAGPGAEPPLAGPALQTAPMLTASTAIEVRVPTEAAEVFFEGVKMTQPGLRRQFTSPPLTPGVTYHYEVRITWTENGKPMTRTRTVEVEAGQSVQIDFTLPQPPPEPMPLPPAPE